MRSVVLLSVIASLASACAAPAPSPTSQPASPDPVAAPLVPISSPSPVPTPAATATFAPAATPTAVFPDESVAPQLDVDFNTAPSFPSPILVVGKTRTSAVGESGCPQIIYEPPDDEFGRQTGMQEACIARPALALAEPVQVNAGYPIVFGAPKGWTLGAQVVFSTDPAGPFWIIEAARLSARLTGPTPLASVSSDGWVEIGRGAGFRIGEIQALAPVLSGDYVVSVQSQVGQTPPKWRTYDRTYYYWIRVP